MNSVENMRNGSSSAAMGYRNGRHFLQIPGPTNIPDRVLHAISQPTIDHRGPEFSKLTSTVLSKLAGVIKTRSPIVIFPSSGTGAWEAALVNVLSPGDSVLMFETGHFATLWKNVAVAFGLKVEFLPGDWRRGVDAPAIEERLAADHERRIRAVAVVHNETSTGVTSDIAAVRVAMDRVGHPALLLVDTISSLGSIDYRHDEWGVDVMVSGSQKGLMLPPGLGINAVSEKAVLASTTACCSKYYWDWTPFLTDNAAGFFPYTPAINLLFGLREVLEMLEEEGLENVFARHARLAEATRRAVAAWGLETQCASAKEHSNSLTGVRMPDGFDADTLRQFILEKLDMSLGAGLSKLKGSMFRIGHLGCLNELTLAGTLCGVEMGLTMCGVPVAGSGVKQALDYFASTIS